jgi:predicted ATPase
VEAAHFLGSLIGVHWEGSPYLLDFNNQPKERVKRAYLMMEELLIRASQRGPVVLILDDLHWADPGSLSLIKYLWQSTERELPLLILSAARPELLQRSELGFEQAEVIKLDPLELTPDLVRQAYPVLKKEPDRLLSILAEKSAGNPYFLEEMVKNIVVDDQVDESRVWKLPDELEQLLKMRLDSLSLEGRATAYFAAVSGRVFWKGTVLAAFRGAPGVTQALDVSSLNMVGKVSKALNEMMEKELAFLRVGSVFSGDREYIFKHGLLQEVAYNRLPDQLKMECHRAVAIWLAERVGPERSICVAQHFEKAGDIDQAQEYYTEAAEQARKQGEDQEADDIQYYARTLH